MPDPIALAVPVFFVLIALELAWAKRRGIEVYRFTDALTDLSCGITSRVAALVWTAAQLGVYGWVYEHARLFTIEQTWLAWLLAFVGVDFLYYWWHRLSHEVNFLWAAHVVHHQSEDYNLAVALRQAVLTSWTALPFYLPLAVLGVPVSVYAVVVALSTLYQFWIHTQLVGRIRGPLDWIFNLPSHHRVHHAINERYLDKNYGATLIVWDRLFGTYAEETETPVYGITKPLGSFDPMWAQVHYWFEMAAMARAARSPWDKIRVWFAAPAWKPRGFVATAPPVEGRSKYDRPLSRRLAIYLGVQYAIVVAVTFLLMTWHSSIDRRLLFLAGVTVLGGLFAFGALIEGRRWAPYVEATRLAVGVVAIVVWFRG